jgi:fucose permease
VRRIAWFGYAVYLLLGWCSVLIPSLIVVVERSFQRTDAAIGLVYLLGALFHAGGALGGGFLAERLGANSVLLVALGILAAGLFVQGWTHTWIVFLAAAALGQSGSGAANGGVQALILEWFPDSRGGALNRLHLVFGLGALCGPATVGVILSFGLNWRPILMGSGAVVLAIALAVTTLPHGDVGAAPAATPGSIKPVSAQERSLRPFLWLAVSIACYEAATMGVVSWLVRFLSDEPVRLATGALSLYWAGICLVRLAAPWLTPRVPAATLTLACLVGSSIALAAAVLAPWVPLALLLCAVTGVFAGPIYPMLIAIGGDLYPRRLAALSGGLTAAATVGAIIYPPLMGIVADQVGIKIGLLGAALLGLPAAAALLLATGTRRHNHTVLSGITAGRTEP